MDICKKPIYPNPSYQNYFENILNGKLSDQVIDCEQGPVYVSKSLLAQTSNYFLQLFTDRRFDQREKFTLEFPKDLLIEYIRFKCKLKIQKTESVMDLIEFASFIQDQSFIHEIFEHVHLHAEEFTDQSLIELRKVFKTFGYY
jgi:hypothetical protein